MKPLKHLLTAALLLTAFSAAGQWVWVEKDGRKVYSDRPPASDIPEKNILKQPANRARLPEPTADTAAAPASAASQAAAARPPASAASATRLSGKDKELEGKKKQAEAAEAAKAKAEEEKQAKAKAENCERAKRGLTALKSGIRLQKTNAKGELEYYSDADRAAETTRLEAATSGC